MEMRHMRCLVKHSWSVALLLIGSASLTGAEKRFVDPKSPDPRSPYTTPKTAAHEISSALEIAERGDTVQVAAGTYRIEKPIIVKKGVILQGAGAAKTILDAEGKCRCVTLEQDASLLAVTATGGSAKEGGGVHCRAGSSVADCIITKNTAQNYGGGICTRVGNPKLPHCVIRDCKIVDNKVTGFLHTDTPLGGGGIYADLNTTVSNCLIEDNEAAQRGGGIWCHLSGALADNCIIVRNRAKGQRARNPNGSGSMEEGGGGAYCDFGGQVRSCLFHDNRADKIGGGVILSTGGNARNCTIVSNSAGISGGGVQTLGVAGLVNSIVWGNTRGANAMSDDVYVSHYYHVDIHQLTLGKANLKHCCIGKTDLHFTKQHFYLGRTAKYDPGRYKNTADAVECIDKDPQLVDAKKGDFRLLPTSPCINAAVTESWMEKATDLDLKARIQDEKADIGAYERKGREKGVGSQ